MPICVANPGPARSLYARVANAVVDNRSLGAAIVVGSLMHAAGHALVAAAGGVLARSLAGSGGSMEIRSTPINIALIGLLAACAKLVGGVVASWAEARVAGEVGATLRLEVLERVIGEHALHAPRQDDHAEAAPRDRSAPGSSRVQRLASLTSHVHDVERGVSVGVLAEIRGALSIAPLVVLLVAVAPSLAGSAAIALVAFALVVFVARRALKRSHANAAREAEELLGAADDAVAHADVWITYGAQKKVRERVVSLSRAAIATAARLRARSAMLSGTSEVLGALALLLVIALAGAGLIGGMDRGAIVPFAIAFFMAYKPLREIVEGRIARHRAEDALSAALATSSGAPRAPSPEIAWSRGELVIDGLVAAHGDHAPVRARVPFGRVLAIVGPTGSGKTSLLRAMLGLDPARTGRVRWGGTDLDDRGAGPLERPFAWVPQDAPVLAGTLRDNVGFGEKSEDEAREILRSIGADTTLATERTLSGGERQWISVARALATELPCILFDEPTSALDDDAQRAMLDAIRALRGRRTVVVVTHRPEPLALADVVVRLSAEAAAA